MNREQINPKDENAWLTLRLQDLTSTDIAALFGISPWLTEFELWHRKKEAAIVAFNANPRMQWGLRLQDAIANGIAQDYSLVIRPMSEYVRLPAFRLGASFDYAIDPDGILEVKNVDSLAYKDGWLIDGESIEAPPHIEIQIQHQLLVSGRTHAYIGALIGGNRVTLIKRESDAQIHEAIMAKSAAFWKSIDENKPPEPDFKADARFLARLHGYAEPGKVMTTIPSALPGLIADYKRFGADETAAKKGKDGVKAEILTLIEDHEKVIGEGFTISAGMLPPTEIAAYTRKGYRDFKVYVKKEKQ